MEGGEWTGWDEPLPALRFDTCMNPGGSPEGLGILEWGGGACLMGECLETASYPLNNIPHQRILRFLVLARPKQLQGCSKITPQVKQTPLPPTPCSPRPRSLPTGHTPPEPWRQLYSGRGSCCPGKTSHTSPNSHWDKSGGSLHSFPFHTSQFSLEAWPESP